MADVKHTPTDYKALGLSLLAKAQAQVSDSEAASNEAFDNTFHKIAADVSRDRWNKIWKMAAQWQRYYTIRTHGHALKNQRDELLAEVAALNAQKDDLVKGLGKFAAIDLAAPVGAIAHENFGLDVLHARALLAKHAGSAS
jgi:hypothetical protein